MTEGDELKIKNPFKRREKQTVLGWLCSDDAYDTLCAQGYTRMSECPEVIMAVNYIANLVSSMTVYLMENTDKGDVRVKNELARMIDITPNKYQTRKAWMYTIVRSMLLEGNGNAVVMPVTNRGLIERLVPLTPDNINFADVTEFDYTIMYKGVPYDPGELLHFAWNIDPNKPYIGQGIRVAAKDIATNLKQAAATKKGFMASKWKPSLIIKVDASTDDFTSKEKRKKMLDDYIETDGAGQPWIIPADMIDVKEVKPLSLKDLAINESVETDKRAIASLIGVPPYVVGVGEFNKNQHNNFIDTYIMPFATGIVQELSNKLLIKDSWFFRFNPRSLYSYSLKEIVDAGSELTDRIAMRRNEWRDWLGFSPDAEMDELLALENYIPAKQLGDQKKLIQKVVEDAAGGE